MKNKTQESKQTGKPVNIGKSAPLVLREKQVKAIAQYYVQVDVLFYRLLSSWKKNLIISYFQNLTLPYTTACLLGIVLLFSRCDSLTTVEPSPAETKSRDLVATTTKAVTTMDGVTTTISCSQETMPSGEIIQICVPTAGWNRQLILYAPGYTSQFEPLHLAPEASIYGPLFTSSGFAFATTSYSQNGLAIQSGIVDMINLRNLFISRHGEPSKIYLTGASQGGIITTLAIERYPELFSGGLSLCGPCGYFQGQINYYGNFRVLFDYFFPGVIPGTVLNIPPQVVRDWTTVYVPAILEAISRNPEATIKLLRVSHAPFEPDDPSTIAQTVVNVLTYNMYLLDARVKLGGQPFDNKKYVYFGTGNAREDFLLNLRVKRYSADRTATQNIRNNYETSGDISIPLVSSHTTKDPIQLFWHLPLYKAKTVLKGNSELFSAIKVDRYGHCTFTQEEIFLAFSKLQLKVLGHELIARASDSEGRIIRSVEVRN